jgi:hypothetical protein
MERFAHEASDSGELIVSAIRESIHSPGSYPYLHNLCEALARTQSSELAPILIDVVRGTPIPVARTAALEALGQLGNPTVVPDLLKWVPLEDELGPLQALFSTLGKLGGDETGDFLADLVIRWIEGDTESFRTGQLAWSALLSMSGPGQIQRLHHVSQGMPQPLRVQALLRLAQLEDFTVGDELETYLSIQHVPQPGVRATAVEGLSLIGRWDALSIAAEDPALGVRMAVIKGLRLSTAISTRAGHDILRGFAQGSDLTLALPALQALCERGDRVLLEPWLRLASTYPEGTQAAEAINLLRQEGVHDERTVPFLLQRWPYCDANSKIDLLRIFGHLGGSQALPLMKKTLHDERETFKVKAMCLVQLGNLGSVSLPLLREYYEEGLSEECVSAWVGALSRIALENTSAEELFIQLAVNPQTRPDVRFLIIENLHQVLDGDAWPVLMEIRSAENPSRVHSFVNDILLEFF